MTKLRPSQPSDCTIFGSLFLLVLLCCQNCFAQFGPPLPPNEFNQLPPDTSAYLLPQRRCYRCANCGGNYHHNNYEYLEPYRVLCGPGVTQCVKLEGPRGNVERYCGNVGEISINEGCRRLSGGVTLCACANGDYCNSSTRTLAMRSGMMVFTILLSAMLLILPTFNITSALFLRRR